MKKKNKKILFIVSLIIGIVFSFFDILMLVLNTTSIKDFYFPLTGIIGSLVMILFLSTAIIGIICSWKYYKEKNTKKLLICFGVLLIISIFMNSNTKYINEFIQNHYIGVNIKKMDSITTKISDNYKYFDVSVEKFDEKIRYELYTEDFSAKEVEQLSNDSDYDKEFEYIIKLDNGDFILLDSNDEGKTINRILYDFSTNQDGYSAGYFIGVLTRLVIEDLNKDDFNNKVGSEFLSKEEIWEKEISVYVYNHLFYALNIEFDKNNNINKSYFIFKPVVEETNEQYQDMIQQIIDEYLQKLEKIEAEEQAKKEQQEKEEQERKEQEEKEKQEALAKKVRIFTAGTYIVGRDIEPGVYNIIAISGRGNCFVTSTTRVIETFTPGGDKYAIAQYNNAILAIGGEIEVHSTLKVKFEPVS